MWGDIVTKLVIFVFKHKRLSIENHALLTTCLLYKVGALPIHEIISTDEQGRIVVNGKVVNRETDRALRESAQAAIRNFALNFVHEQVLYAAVAHGVNKLEKIEQSYFSRAAIWYGQMEKDILTGLAGVEQSEPDA